MATAHVGGGGHHGVNPEQGGPIGPPLEDLDVSEHHPHGAAQPHVQLEDGDRYSLTVEDLVLRRHPGGELVILVGPRGVEIPPHLVPYVGAFCGALTGEATRRALLLLAQHAAGRAVPPEALAWAVTLATTVTAAAARVTLDDVRHLASLTGQGFTDHTASVPREAGDDGA